MCWCCGDTEPFDEFPKAAGPLSGGDGDVGSAASTSTGMIRRRRNVTYESPFIYIFVERTKNESSQHINIKFN
jgi:hypothetical protein